MSQESEDTKTVCSCCGGSGYIEESIDDENGSVRVECSCCDGTGYQK